jgi:ribosome-binding protein aMBF1 (putative translation factor)
MGKDSDSMLQSQPPARSGEAVDPSIGTAEHRRLVQQLRALREQAGLTQAELAARIDERQAFVSVYERGQRRLDVIELRKIALAIGEPAAPIVSVLDTLTSVMTALGGKPQ